MTFLMASAATGLNLVQIVLAGLGSGGLIGALVAIFKLKPDANTQAVTQSRDAMEVMAKLNAELEKERDEWRKRALTAERQQSQRQRP